MTVAKTVVVTGGAKGIGAVVARKFAANGYRICLWDVLIPPANLLKELETDSGPCMYAQVDVFRRSGSDESCIRCH